MSEHENKSHECRNIENRMKYCEITLLFVTNNSTHLLFLVIEIEDIVQTKTIRMKVRTILYHISIAVSVADFANGL